MDLTQGNQWASLKILVVDDNPVDRGHALSIIHRYKQSTYTANDGCECLDSLSKYPIDLIFMDIHLEDENSFDIFIT